MCVRTTTRGAVRTYILPRLRVKPTGCQRTWDRPAPNWFWAPGAHWSGGPLPGVRLAARRSGEWRAIGAIAARPNEAWQRSVPDEGERIHLAAVAQPFEVHVRSGRPGAPRDECPLSAPARE